MEQEIDNDSLELNEDDKKHLDKLLDIREEAMKNFEVAKDAWESIHSAYIHDYKFAQGEQWDSSTLKNRQVNNRSALVYNKLPANIRYICNNARMNTPAIKVHPINDGATANTAKIIDGIIKNIEYKSSAKTAYIKSLECAVTGGIGCFQVVVGDNELDGKPDIIIKQLKDPTSLYLDPSSDLPTFQDAKWAFLVKWVDKETFEELYPDYSSSCIDESHKDWYSKDSIQVVEYWVKKDGKVNYYLITGDEVLEVNEKYPGRFLPFCFVTGSEVFVDGDRSFKGIVRDVIDQQKLLNYTKSETADYITKSAKQKWLVEADHIADYQEIWDSNNVDSYNYLPYKSKDGTRPTKIDPDVPPTGFMTTSQEADADIRATIGIRDPLQDIPASQSGKAIQLQISQGNIGTYEFIDNLNQAIRYCGFIMVDLIPHFYNYPHIREIMGLDENVTPTPIMTAYIDNGEQVIHDLKKGYYSVTISTGPSYESQRTEAADKLIELVDKYPAMMTLAGDLIVRNLDFKGSEELADRLRTMVPPNALNATNSQNGNKDMVISTLQSQMSEMQNQFQMMNEQNQQLQAQLQQASMMMNDKNADRQFEISKKNMELENTRILKQMDIEFQKEQMIYNKQKELEMKEEDVNSKAYLGQLLDTVETQNNISEYEAKKEIDGTQNITLII